MRGEKKRPKFSLQNPECEVELSSFINEINAHTFCALSVNNKSIRTSMNNETENHFFIKSPKPNLSSTFPHRLRAADILLADQDHGGADSMDGAGEAPPPRHGYRHAKCYSPWRLVARLLAALRLNKDHRALQRRQNEARDSETTSLPMNISNGSEESGEKLRLFSDSIWFS